MPDSQRLLLADADANVRAALRLLLARHPRLQVVAEVENLEELQRASSSLELDLVLLDMDLRGLTADDLRAICTRAATVVLSTRDEHLQNALDAGAAAFVCKSESPQHLLRVLQRVASAIAGSPQAAS